MTTAEKNATKLNALVKKYASADPPEWPDQDDPVAVLVFSFLLWETTSEKALIAYRHIRSSVVDFNELRVCMADEIQDIIGVRYPGGIDRCHRLRATLRDLYSREHAVTLEAVSTLGKRDVRKYLDSLEGIVPFIASRVALLSFDAHAIPVDEQLRARLIDEGVIGDAVDLAETISWLERQIKATEARQAHMALQRAVETAPKRRSRSKTTKKTSKSSKSAANASGKKTSRKKTASSKRPTRKKAAGKT